MQRLIVLNLAFLLLSIPVHALTLRVPGEYPTIQAGINAAADGDTVMVAPGIYTGDGNINLSLVSRSVVVMSEYGPGNCIIDCQCNGRAASFSGTDTSVLYGFTIQNGLSTQGGGISVLNGSPTIERCIIKDNSSSGSGGGFYINGSNPTITHCTIVDNLAYHGGAIYFVSSNPVINSNIIYSNTSGVG